ncbi:sulfatase [Olivibacter sp. SDN3]|uniref:sulfatase n=1 Tax=Olivibacter sp. SDN3 TaxID=2764720 RepID=UPI0016510637|nr:sulfatase [Olivibacter sp. SDN3]QNL47860.1 sulfatase [Olivibacter sp. SDN3]
MQNKQWLLLFFIGILCWPCKAQDNRPNVLFIVVDDLRPTLGCYGDSIVHTPNIDALARRGVLFEKAYCQEAVCSPSRTSFLTGLRPDSTHIWDLKETFRNTQPAIVTLPQYFKNNGYVTASAGKIYHDPATHQDSLSWSGPVRYNVTQNAKGHKYINDKNLTGVKGAATERENVQDTAYIDGKVAEASIEILSQLRSQSFFLAVGFRRPHLPFSVPDQYWRIYDQVRFPLPLNQQPVEAPWLAFHDSQELRGYMGIAKTGNISSQTKQALWQGYYASVSYIDAQIGKLLKALDRFKLTENTIVVLLSDHGYHLGEQNLWGKSTNFENAVRVPLIVSAPNMKGQGVKSESLVELLDIYPTLVDYCRLPAKEDLQGITFKPSFDHPHHPGKGFAMSQFIRPYSALMGEDTIEYMGYSLRTERYRYTEWYPFNSDSIVAREIYDHVVDPQEMVNKISTADEGLLNTLHHQLRDLIKD